MESNVAEMIIELMIKSFKDRSCVFDDAFLLLLSMGSHYVEDFDKFVP